LVRSYAVRTDLAEALALAHQSLFTPIASEAPSVPIEVHAFKN
jgi:hypothetical protein